MPPTIHNVVQFLNDFAPPALSEEWDNTGLLIGDESQSVSKILTCLTLTPDVAEEAVDQQMDLIVSHHPVLFRKVQRLTTENVEGAMLLKLIQAGIAVYSPHTSFDSAPRGINQQLAERLKLTDIQPIRPADEESNPAEGSGRLGTLKTSESFGEFLNRVRENLDVARFQYVGDESLTVERVGVACGSAAEFLSDAHRLDCQAFVTGEARFHSFLEARSLGIGMVVIGHYQSERPAVEHLAKVLEENVDNITAFPSRVEEDPVHWSIG